MTPPTDPWTRLDRVLADHLLGDLAPGASEADVNALAAQAGVASPEPFRTLYRAHDGQRSPGPGLFFGLRFLSTREAAEEWDRWASLLRDDPALVADIEVGAHPEGAVRAVYASPAWVPFASDGAGNHLALDFDPGPDGMLGQVITFGADEPVRYVLAPSAADFLDWCARQCETGVATVAPDPDAPGGRALRLRGGRGLLDAVPALFGDG